MGAPHGTKFYACGQRRGNRDRAMRDNGYEYPAAAKECSIDHSQEVHPKDDPGGYYNLMPIGCNKGSNEWTNYLPAMVDAVAESDRYLAMAYEEGRITGDWSCPLCGMSHFEWASAEACCTPEGWADPPGTNPRDFVPFNREVLRASIERVLGGLGYESLCDGTDDLDLRSVRMALSPSRRYARMTVRLQIWLYNKLGSMAGIPDPRGMG